MNEAVTRTQIEEEKGNLRKLIEDSEKNLANLRRFQVEEGAPADRAEPITTLSEAEAVLASLKSRIEALERAEQRLDDGTYGRSVRSGATISRERLEADPAAELTFTEAQQESSNFVDERADEI